MVVKPKDPSKVKEMDQALENNFQDPSSKKLSGVLSDGFYEVTFDSRSLSLVQQSQKLSSLSKNNNWAHINPAYILNGDTTMTYDVFVIKLKNAYAMNNLKRLNQKYNVEIIGRNELVNSMIKLRVPSGSKYNVFELSRIYFENLNLDWSTPDFKRKAELLGPSTNPYYQYQFYLNMTSASKAWEIHDGDSNIIVAVVDEGVESHSDLPDSDLVTGYDAMNRTGFAGDFKL